MPVLSPSRSTSVRTVRQGHQPPMPVRVEAEAERNRREAFGGEDHDQRIAAAAIGHPSGEQAQAFEGEGLGQLQLQHPAVFGPLRIKARNPPR